MEYTVTTFYKFMPLEEGQLLDFKQILEDKAKSLNIFGLILIAPEGVNATLAGLPGDVASYKDWLVGQFGELVFKDSPSEMMPFKRFKVKVRAEIVQLGRTDIKPTGEESHISPEAWDEMMAKEDVVLIDVRNWYEAKLGTFKGAINPQTKTFQEFPDWLKKSGIAKGKKIGIFCTGEIRCEKAAVAMKEQGYDNVHSLEGGVLNYIEKRPNSNFDGECFVFDHRSAVGQDLRPSAKYKVCSSCGNGAALTATCVNCDKEYRICDDCAAASAASLCSKNCRYIFSRAKA
jgi:UPF0176 protein